MSRAALWRQEGNVKERERVAEEIFENAVAEGRQKGRARNVLPLWGPDDSFHFNPLLLKNTIHSPYFQKSCRELNDWNAVIDQIYYEVTHVQPFSSADKLPSTAFCLLLRMLTLRMTDHQLELTLKHPDSPYIRAIGFLYLRYAGPPDQILHWIEPYFFDHETIKVEAAQRTSSTTTIGEYVRNLFDARDYHGTPLPRYPIQTERELRVRILAAEKIAERAARHFKNQQNMRQFQTLGSQVMALYGDDENPTTWYQAVVDRVISTDEAGFALVHPTFVVTFTEYGNTETVNLGEMDTLDGNWKNEDPAKELGRGDGDLYDEVRRRDRETSTASKGWARKPPTTKSMLSQPSGSGRRHALHDDVSPPRKRPPHSASERQSRDNGADEQNFKLSSSPKKRTAEEMAAIAEKKRKLISKYG